MGKPRERGIRKTIVALLNGKFNTSSATKFKTNYLRVYCFFNVWLPFDCIVQVTHYRCKWQR